MDLDLLALKTVELIDALPPSLPPAQLKAKAKIVILTALMIAQAVEQERCTSTLTVCPSCGGKSSHTSGCQAERSDG
ncbi:MULTISPECIES: hypothetical protein [unclassified Bradyrhizobium]|uniref:hypothetical protein n=1 Tax=unclassified Bradyrhizobium TaxID=2631580 RepID=UPI0029163C37|nr:MULTISPECIES: hypothetical protein [unclassified Bradyrhizobium]